MIAREVLDQFQLGIVPKIRACVNSRILAFIE